MSPLLPLPLGQAVTNRDSQGIIVRIHGTQTPETIENIGGCVACGGSAEFDVVFSDGRQSLRLPEALVRTSGVWKVIEGAVATADDIANAIRFAEQKAGKLEPVKPQTQTQDAIPQTPPNVARFIAENPTLKTRDALNPKGERYSDHALGALNLKTQLTERWPGIKFSVSSRSYAGGESIDVRWTDGPTSAEVDALCSLYTKGHFNGSDDSYSYKKDRAWTDTFGSARHVSSRRELGAALKFSMASAICQRLGVEFKSYDQKPFIKDGDHDDLGTLTYRCLHAVEVPSGCTEVTGLEAIEGGHGQSARYRPLFAAAPAPAVAVADRRSAPKATAAGPKAKAKGKARLSSIVDDLNARNAPPGGWTDADKAPKPSAVPKPAPVASVAVPTPRPSASSPRRLPADLMAAIKKVPAAMLGYLAKQAGLSATEGETVRGEFTAWVADTGCPETDWRKAWTAFAAARSRSRRGDEAEATPVPQAATVPEPATAPAAAPSAASEPATAVTPSPVSEVPAPVAPAVPARPFPVALAKELLRLPGECICFPMGDHNVDLRKRVLGWLLGRPVTRREAGSTAVRDALATHFGVDRNDCNAGIEAKVVHALRRIAGEPEPEPVAYVGAAIADAFGMRGLPNTRIADEPPFGGTDIERQFAFCAKAFRVAISRIATVAGMAPTAVYALWREYSDRCDDADQCPVLGEFVEWCSEKLGGDESALADAVAGESEDRIGEVFPTAKTIPFPVAAIPLVEPPAFVSEPEPAAPSRGGLAWLRRMRQSAPRGDRGGE